MIEATCIVDDERYKQYVWPYTFITLPRIGDTVEGYQQGKGYSQGDTSRITLQVLEIIHTTQWRGIAGATSFSPNPQPIIKLRLGKGKKRWTSKI